MHGEEESEHIKLQMIESAHKKVEECYRENSDRKVGKSKSDKSRWKIYCVCLLFTCLIITIIAAFNSFGAQEDYELDKKPLTRSVTVEEDVKKATIVATKFKVPSTESFTFM